MKKLVLIPFHKYQQLESLRDKARVEEDSPTKTSQLDPNATHEFLPTTTHEDCSTETNRLDKDLVLCHIGKNRSKAETLLRYIENSPTLDWNEKGELLVEGKPIVHSHISDIIKDSQTAYKDFEPIGVEEFYKHLSNIPLTIISNPKRRLLIQTGGQNIPPPPGQPAVIKLRELKPEVQKPVKRLKTLSPKSMKDWKALWKAL